MRQQHNTTQPNHIRLANRSLNLIFALFGLGALGIACVMLQDTRDFLEDTVATKGRVVKFEVESKTEDGETRKIYKPVIEYKDQNGFYYTFTSNMGSTLHFFGIERPLWYAENDIVDVLYKRSLPEQARINGFLELWSLVAFFGGTGFVFVYIVLWSVLHHYLKRSRIRALLRDGVSVKATFAGIKINELVQISKQHPHQIMAMWQDPATSETRHFISENIWFDPADYVTDKEINVFIDKGDWNNYYVDTSFLPFPELQEPF